MSVLAREWKQPDGSIRYEWVVDYRDREGKRRRPAFMNKRAADAEWLRIQTELGLGTHTPDSDSITVAEAAKRWLAENHALEQSTLVAYRQHVDLRINKYLGNIKLSKLDMPKVKEFETWMHKNGTSPAMVRKARIVLGAIISAAQESGLVAQNVVKNLRRKRTRRILKRAVVGVDIPSAEDIHAIIAKLNGRYRPLLLTAIFTGLRASELRGLPWRDVDFQNSELNVTQRADRYNKIGPPKSDAGHRTIPLGDKLISVLKAHKLACPNGSLGLAFPNSKGKVDHLNTIVKYWQAVQIEAGIVDQKGKAKYPGLHALRHRFASWCINREADGGRELPQKFVQRLMGHSSINVTIDVYGHLFPQRDSKAEVNAAERRYFR